MNIINYFKTKRTLIRELEDAKHEIEVLKVEIKILKSNRALVYKSLALTGLKVASYFLEKRELK